MLVGKVIDYKIDSVDQGGQLRKGAPFAWNVLRTFDVFCEPAESRLKATQKAARNIKHT